MSGDEGCLKGDSHGDGLRVVEKHEVSYPEFLPPLLHLLARLERGARFVVDRPVAPVALLWLLVVVVVVFRVVVEVVGGCCRGCCGCSGGR